MYAILSKMRDKEFRWILPFQILWILRQLQNFGVVVVSEKSKKPYRIIINFWESVWHQFHCAEVVHMHFDFNHL